jgi:hypothetical protein
MGKLTADEQKLLADLQAKIDAEDEDDFEIEIYDTAKGKGARLPVSQGRKFLWDNFGIGEDPNPAPADPKAKSDGKGQGDDGGPAKRPTGYLGRAQAG